MITLTGYTLKEEIYTGEKSIVYRGEKSGQPVVVKILQKEYPEASDIASFKQEYEILSKLNSPRLIKVINVEKYKNSIAIIFEDIGGESLTKLFKNLKSHSLSDFLNVIIMTLNALDEIHKLNIIHRDLKPQNIILNEKTGELRIIDFGSASQLSKQNSFVALNSSLEGTLAYISPEQTGRMNRTVDYRTDFYSLGITFYQLLTGELPFYSADPMELIHSHIAKTPVSPFDKNKIPKSISNIIMKLLEKNPENRYQSVSGILFDFEQCAKSLNEGGIDLLNKLDIKIAEKDFSSKFQIPEKLYGRANEIFRIVESAKDVAKGNIELLLISGRSGIGKSVLINEVNKPITEFSGYFASGKYDQFKRSIPYRAISQAFQSLTQQILTENQVSIQEWKQLILNAVGVNGKIIIDIIPELELLIGEQPLVAELEASESQNRFTLVFQNFIKACCSAEHPITIFLDDMQWADNASIQLLESVLSDPAMKYFLLMLSFRDNEVLPTDTFSLLLDKLKKANFPMKEILLDPILQTDVNQLVAETLSYPEAATVKIAEVIYLKTKGNPFFVNEVFKSLYDKELIYPAQNKWTWDIDKIKEVKISENVIDLMIEKIKELSPESIRVIKLAACIGDWFHNDVFLQIAEMSKDDFEKELKRISDDGFFINNGNITRFVHDKIREATYTLISKEERETNHYKIGNVYLNGASAEQIEDLVFTIVNQLNEGIIYVISKEEKNKLVELNLLAGKKSIASTAYEVAVNFFNVAVSLLEDNSWETNYEKTLQTYIGKSTSEYLSKDFETAEKSFEFILGQTKNILDKINIYELRFSMYVSQNRMLEVLALGREVLKTLNISLPKNPSDISPLPEIIKAKIKLGKKPVNTLVNLKDLTDEKLLATLRLLNMCVAPSFISLPKLFPVLVLKMTNLSLSNGISPLSAFAFTCFGLIQGSALGDFEAGYNFGKLGIDLVTKLNANAIYCKTYFIFATMVNHWKFHAKENKKLYLSAIEKGMETGDLQYTSYCINHFNLQPIIMRENLATVSDNLKKYYPLMNSLKQTDSTSLFRLNQQVVDKLLGRSEEVQLNKREYFDEKTILNDWLIANNSHTLFIYYLFKGKLAYLFDTIQSAHEYSNLALPHEGAVFGMMFIPEHVFFDSLISAELYLVSDKTKQKELKKRLEKNLKRMQKWAENCAANYGHKFHIMQSLLYSIAGANQKILPELKKAILLAKEHEYILEEAIANELCAKFWMSTGNEEYAQLHLVETHYAYKKWGCLPKVKMLEEKYPFLKKQANVSHSSDSTVSSSSTILGSTSSGNFLDLGTVLKASQTLAGEIHLGKLLERMLKILFENAGAERGFFILKEKDKWLIQAEGNSNTDITTVLQAVSLDDSSQSLSPAIINYVIRTKTLVILDDAAKKGMYTNDVYVKTQKPKSVLCYPIINQGNLVGVVYLENNQTTNAFTPDRIEILKILSSQIAVSIENSLLYSNLEEKVNERTRDLNQALVEVRSLKEQQDGDYFLTTLLIEPLAQNNANSELLKIDFFIKQKKTFMFRKGEYEIGGDINITESIELKDRRYTLFLNGDAMGKSIQGAGGVLVLGTVFKSIVQRTIATSYGKSVYPERWLKNAFIEMHKVFESFDGSMLMSLVFGLIDEITGTMYYIGAEHPDVILFRDSKASFLENQNQYRKLGTQGQKGNIQVEVFSFQANDIVIFGSDGRDDIILGKNPTTGKDDINNDEFLILRKIEAAGADLATTYTEILKSGKQFDDLSLLRIEWTGNTVLDPVYEMESRLFTDYIEDENYQLAEPLGLKLIEKNPSNSELLYKISIGLNKMGKFEEAVDLGERLYLRNPKHQKNLICLLGSYISLGNLDRAKSLWKQGEKMKILNDELRKIGEEYQL
jgi:predicted ATPase/tRNA A-37 threonylcarbamoyl transferase component Bud32